MKRAYELYQQCHDYKVISPETWIKNREKMISNWMKYLEMIDKCCDLEKRNLLIYNPLTEYSKYMIDTFGQPKIKIYSAQEIYNAKIVVEYLRRIKIMNLSQS